MVLTKAKKARRAADRQWEAQEKRRRLELQWDSADPWGLQEATPDVFESENGCEK